MPVSKVKIPEEGGLALVDKEAYEKVKAEDETKHKLSQSKASELKERKPMSEAQKKQNEELIKFNKTEEGKKKMADGRLKKKMEKDERLRQEQLALKKMVEDNTIPEGKAVVEVAPKSKRGRPKTIKPFEPTVEPTVEPTLAVDDDDSEEDENVDSPKPLPEKKLSAKTPRPYKKRVTKSSDSETPASDDSEFEQKMTVRERRKKAQIATLDKVIKNLKEQAPVQEEKEEKDERPMAHKPIINKYSLFT